MDHTFRHVLAASALGALLVAAGTLLSGCVVESYGCTAMGGITGLSLTVLPVTPGDYDIVVRSDVVEAQCPFTRGRDGQTTFGTCDTRVGYVYPGYGPGIEGGAELLLTGDSNTVPRSVEVQVFDANANELVRRQLQPAYSESYPNGRECDIEPSLYAREQIVLPEVVPGPPSVDAGTSSGGPGLDAGVRPDGDASDADTDADADADAAID